MASSGGKHIAPSSSAPREREREARRPKVKKREEEWEEELDKELEPEEKDDDLEWEAGWESEAERRSRRTPGWLKALRTVLILLLVVAVALFAADMIQKDVFAGQTDINGIPVSRLSAEEATTAVSNALQLDKQVTLTDLEGDALAQLNVKDMLRSGDVKTEVTKLLNTQHEQFLPLAIIGQGGESYSLGWLDEGSLEAMIAGAIGDYGKSDATPSELVNGSNGWEIVPGEDGTMPDLATAAAKLASALKGGSLSNSLRVSVPTVNVPGDFSEHDALLKSQMDAINAVMGKSVTIVFGEDLKVTLSRAQLSGAYTVELTDKGAEAALNEEALRAVVDAAIEQNQADGIERKYRTLERHGAEVHYNDWDAGWVVNRDALYKAVADAIKNGGEGDVTAEYNYVGSVKQHFKSGNNSFIEINLQNQYLWFYRKGKLVMSTPIVSGSIANNTPTPAGAFSVSYTKKNAKLAGDGYSYEVNYWIPFYGNVGIHDATWRTTEYGGDVYLTGDGSHGCIEVPEEAAALIFENASTYIPVFVY